jgi:hypothetical protein
VYEGASLLYQIDQEKLWEGNYDSFGEYVEQECQLSQGYASKLLQSWKFYVIEGGLSQAKLQIEQQTFRFGAFLVTFSSLACFSTEPLRRSLQYSRQELKLPTEVSLAWWPWSLILPSSFPRF